MGKGGRRARDGTKTRRGRGVIRGKMKDGEKMKRVRRGKRETAKGEGEGMGKLNERKKITLRAEETLYVK